jgi:acyl transferase domain-containing protein
MREAHRRAAWNPRDLIECHGTGTAVGDAVELGPALWSERTGVSEGGSTARRCVLGSVKSNVGHLLTAAGAAGLAKVLLALRHRTLPLPRAEPHRKFVPARKPLPGSLGPP